VPEFQEDARGDPVPKPGVGRGFGAQLGLIQGCPLAACAEHLENGVGTAPIGDTWTAATKAVGLHLYREQRGKHGPERIRNPKPGGRAVVRCTGTYSFGGLP
jgi:hypothetical protein